MRKIYTLFAAFAIAMAFILSSTSPPVFAAEQSKIESMKILIVGSPGVGLPAALAEAIRSTGAEQVVIVQSDDDGLTAYAAEMPFIVNKRDILPITTAAGIETEIQLKTETQRSVSNFTQRTFYDLPPNDYGYRGESFANLTRDSSRS